VIDQRIAEAIATRHSFMVQLLGQMLADIQDTTEKQITVEIADAQLETREPNDRDVDHPQGRWRR
jgi:hypothetical protein